MVCVCVWGGVDRRGAAHQRGHKRDSCPKRARQVCGPLDTDVTACMYMWLLHKENKKNDGERRAERERGLRGNEKTNERGHSRGLPKQNEITGNTVYHTVQRAGLSTSSFPSHRSTTPSPNWSRPQ